MRKNKPWGIVLVLLAIQVNADERFNSGGGPNGEYGADQFFSGGGTRSFYWQQGIYATERQSSSAFRYSIPVTPGRISVTLRFRESCFWCGIWLPPRIFDVVAEGETVLSDFQVPRSRTSEQTFAIQSDETLDLVFVASSREAFVNAIEVVENGVEAPTLEISAQPNAIVAGASSTVSWRSAHTANCKGSGGMPQDVSTSGTLPVTPNETTDYSLNCTGYDGTQIGDTATVTVVPPPSADPPTLSFSVVPTAIVSGESALLNWASEKTTECVGEEGWGGAQPLEGSEIVYPKVTTRYALVCKGEDASEIERDVTVTVQDSPQDGKPSLLRVSSANGRYFENAEGELVVLSGSHTWFVVQNVGLSYPPQEFNFTAYLDFIESHGHNFLKLWTWEHTRWATFESNNNIWFDPPVYARPGPGVAIDGRPRFDLDQFDQRFFDRLRARAIEAGERGFYASVTLFNGFSLGYKGSGNAGNPWRGHPFNRANNINGIDGDVDRDGFGHETHTLSSPAVLARHKAYVRKVIDTLNDLDNVLYEVSNESEANSERWQQEILSFIRTYEATKPKQHPIGITVEYPNGSNSEILSSQADWVSLRGSLTSPPPASGNKIVLADTDHLCGINCRNPKWVWKSFTRGENPIVMDPYQFLTPDGSIDTSSNWQQFRRRLGQVLEVAGEFDLADMPPQSGSSVCQSGYCLADTVTGRYIVYSPSSRSVRVNNLPVGTYTVTWLNPTNGQRVSSSPITGGGNRQFVAPRAFPNEVVLLLKR